MNPAPAPGREPPESLEAVPPTPAEIASDLVNQYPGSTLGELLCYTGLADGSALARHYARQALVPALHAAEIKRSLIRGPMRLCHQGSGVVSTWLPAKTAAARTRTSGLVALEDMVHDAAVRLQEQETA